MNALPPAIVGSPMQAAQSAVPTSGRRTCNALDGLAHAAEARATFGLSPVAQGLAFLD